MRDLTLRQVEVIRAVMMTGTISGAADFLDVSAPGISRLLKHTEESLGVRLFERKAGLFVPRPRPRRSSTQINQVYEKMAGLTHALASLKRGRDAELAFASMPSVAQFLAARTVRHVRQRFPELYIDLNVLKIEEAVDYLLLERGEFVAMSYRFPHPSLDFRLLGTGQLVAIVPEGHSLAGSGPVATAPPRRGTADRRRRQRPLRRDHRRAVPRAGSSAGSRSVARFAQTVVSLVRHGLGVAIIDEFSVAGVYMPGLARLPLAEPVEISVYAAQQGRPRAVELRRIRHRPAGQRARRRRRQSAVARRTGEMINIMLREGRSR